MTFSERLLEIDGNILIGIQHSLNADWFTEVMKAVSFLSNAGWLWILLCLALIAYPKTRRVGVICAASLLFAFIMCNGVVKLSIDRARPWELIEGVKMLIPDPGDSSFPSGHANASMATAWALWLATRKGNEKLHRYAWGAIVLALITGLSRVYLGMHFPSDVIAGLLIGLICSTIVYIIIIKYEKKNGIICLDRMKGSK